jgi:formiminoglutamate deiminase
MPTIFATKALLPEGWQENVRVHIADGRIGAVTANATAQPGDITIGILLPALSNLHSHTFQRAMAGMTEKRGTEPDSFWTWRDVMYRFLQHLTPDDIESIAAFAFMEMQQAGFAAVAEFHYIHHALQGAPYGNRAELSARIMAAANTSGIGLTLLPVLYTYAGPGRKPLAGPQLRFGNSHDAYRELHAAAKSIMTKSMPGDCGLGVAPHSLRAVDAGDIARLAEGLPDLPFHLHIAEQTAEVEAILAATGQTPVAWLLDHAAVAANWCLVHATHMTTAETSGLAATGATAGLCPVTEANLGDGIFNGAEFLAAGGSFGVGTDSNINISVSDELAMLEYSQRLRHRQRNVLTTANVSTGEHLYRCAAAGGARALGRATGAIGEGLWADLVAIDACHTQLCALHSHQLLDGWIFASGERSVTDLWSAGRHCVAQGRHRNGERIIAAYRKTVTELISRL